MNHSGEQEKKSENAQMHWHSLSEPEIFKFLNTGAKGISSEEAEARIKSYGANILPQADPPTWWEIGIRQFQSPFVYIYWL